MRALATFYLSKLKKLWLHLDRIQFDLNSFEKVGQELDKNNDAIPFDLHEVRTNTSDLA